MSEQARGGAADEGAGDGGGDEWEPTDDPWMSTVMTVSGLLAGFSLASVVVIAAGPKDFRWPGAAELALTIASVVLVGAAQGSRNGAYYYEDYKLHWRVVIWVLYRGGLVALAVGLWAALMPRAGTGGQEGLRRAAAYVAFFAAIAEVLFSLRPAFWKNFKASEEAARRRRSAAGHP